MTPYNDIDFRKYSDFEFNAFMELKGGRVTDEHYSIEGGGQSGLISWFKRFFLNK